MLPMCLSLDPDVPGRALRRSTRPTSRSISRPSVSNRFDGLLIPRRAVTLVAFAAEQHGSKRNQRHRRSACRHRRPSVLRFLGRHHGIGRQVIDFRLIHQQEERVQTFGARLILLHRAIQIRLGQPLLVQLLDALLRMLAQFDPDRRTESTPWGRPSRTPASYLPAGGRSTACISRRGHRLRAGRSRRTGSSRRSSRSRCRCPAAHRRESNSVRMMAPVGQLSRHPARAQCLQTSDENSQENAPSSCVRSATGRSMNATCRQVDAPRCDRVVVGHAGEQEAVVRQLVPLLASHFAGLAADAERRIGKESFCRRHVRRSLPWSLPL